MSPTKNEIPDAESTMDNMEKIDARTDPYRGKLFAANGNKNGEFWAPEASLAEAVNKRPNLLFQVKRIDEIRAI